VDEEGALGLYPDLEPYEYGMLDVGEGHLVYWESCGNPDGKPAVVVHGGPGSGCAPGWRRFFNPEAYRIVLFDQRNCGRSTPHAGAQTIDLSTNTTHHLITDVEQLRVQLGIDRWLVFGGSWGTTLSLAYAEQHPDRVSEMVLFSVAITRHRDVHWITRDMGRHFPAEWERFRAGVAPGDRDGDLAAAYSLLLRNADPTVRDEAARNWCAWEDTHVSLLSGHQHDPRYDDAAFRLCFARLVTHYWSHAAFLDDDQLLGNVDKVAHIPAILVHGRADLSSPLDVPWGLVQGWPASRLIVIEAGGHGAGAGLADTLVSATDRFGQVG
jgi:proline iminopeptidase